MIRAAIFDFDGTLVKYTLDYQSARDEVMEFLRVEGFSPDVYREMRITAILEAVRTELEKGDRSSDYEVIKGRVFEIVGRYEAEAAQETDLHSGVVEALEALKKWNLKIGLVTMNNSMVVEGILKRTGIEGFFDAVVCRGDVDLYKPHPEPLNIVMERLGVLPRETIYIGDSPVDVEAARSARILSIAVTIGIASRELLSKSRPNYITSTLFETVRVVEGLLAETA